MICANIRKSSQDEQQNQKTTTTNNYIKNFMSVLETKLNNEVKKSNTFKSQKDHKLSSIPLDTKNNELIWKPI